MRCQLPCTRVSSGVRVDIGSWHFDVGDRHTSAPALRLRRCSNCTEHLSLLRHACRQSETESWDGRGRELHGRLDWGGRGDRVTEEVPESELQGADPRRERTHSGYVLSVARRRGSSSGLGTVTKSTPLRRVLGCPAPTPSRQLGRENRAQSR
eukprot:364344-Chlamydomonas_euryale.AAC.6